MDATNNNAEYSPTSSRRLSFEAPVTPPSNTVPSSSPTPSLLPTTPDTSSAAPFTGTVTPLDLRSGQQLSIQVLPIPQGHTLKPVAPKTSDQKTTEAAQNTLSPPSVVGLPVPSLSKEEARNLSTRTSPSPTPPAPLPRDNNKPAVEPAKKELAPIGANQQVSGSNRACYLLAAAIVLIAAISFAALQQNDIELIAKS